MRPACIVLFLLASGCHAAADSSAKSPGGGTDVVAGSDHDVVAGPDIDAAAGVHIDTRFSSGTPPDAVTDTDVAPEPDTSPSASCDYHLCYCQDYESGAETLGVYQGACERSGGDWSSGPCSHADVLGGCRDASDAWVVVTSWFTAESGYTSSEDVQTSCEGSGGEYVAP